MNIKKVNNEALKHMLKVSAGKERPSGGEIVEDKLYLTIDGFELILIDLKDYHINITNKENFKIGSFKRMVNGYYDNIDTLEEVEKIELIGKYGDIKNVIKLVGKSKSVYFNNDLLKYFDKDCKLLISGKETPIYILENDVLVGLVLPLRYNK